VAHWKSLPADAIGIFLLTAWPEELLFRGLLQNSLTRTLSSESGGWILASIIFGLAHITNSGVFPNWRYALLATIAGIFYGRTWRKTASIFPAAIVHALVDTTWHLLFRTL
jgi:membrane protease YdiL (CAAX protease family)